MKAFGISDTGRVRPSNEDLFLIAELTKTMRIWQTSLPSQRRSSETSAVICFLSPTVWEAAAPANRRAPWPSSRSSNSRSIIQVVFPFDKPEAQMP